MVFAFCASFQKLPQYGVSIKNRIVSPEGVREIGISYAQGTERPLVTFIKNIPKHSEGLPLNKQVLRETPNLQKSITYQQLHWRFTAIISKPRFKEGLGPGNVGPTFKEVGVDPTKDGGELGSFFSKEITVL